VVKRRVIKLAALQKLHPSGHRELDCSKKATTAQRAGAPVRGLARGYNDQPDPPRVVDEADFSGAKEAARRAASWGRQQTGPDRSLGPLGTNKSKLGTILGK